MCKKNVVNNTPFFCNKMDKKSPKVILLLQNSEPFLFGCQLIKSPKVILLLHNSEPLLSFTYCGYIEGTSKCEIFLLWAQLRQWLQTRHHKLWKQMDGTLPTVSITVQQQVPCNYWTCSPSNWEKWSISLPHFRTGCWGIPSKI